MRYWLHVFTPGKFKYGKKSTKTVCSLQHKNKDVAENELEDNLETAEKHSEILREGIKTKIIILVEFSKGGEGGGGSTPFHQHN